MAATTRIVEVARFSHVLDSYLRRNRRAFDVARECQGARSVAQSGAFP